MEKTICDLEQANKELAILNYKKKTISEKIRQIKIIIKDFDNDKK